MKNSEGFAEAKFGENDKARANKFEPIRKNTDKNAQSAALQLLQSGVKTAELSPLQQKQIAELVGNSFFLKLLCGANSDSTFTFEPNEAPEPDDVNYIVTEPAEKNEFSDEIQFEQSNFNRAGQNFIKRKGSDTRLCEIMDSLNRENKDE